MRARRLARWLAGLVAVAAFGVAAILGITAANADVTAEPTPAEGGQTHQGDAWD